MRRSPPQGFARSSRFAGLSGAACAPLPRRPPCEGGGSFRNNSVPEDEPDAKLPQQSRAKTRPLSGTHRQDHRRARSRHSAMAATVGQDRLRRRHGAVNAATGHRYRGINLFVLGMSPLAFASNDSRWCSYRQAAARGWQVRKGEKATPVYFYKPIEIEDKTSDGGRETRRIPILRTFSVFHACQIDGIPALAPAVATKAVAERIEDVEIIVQASGVPVRIGGDRALYNPTFDFIQLPPDEAFHSQELRAATLFHELSHATGHVSRLNRDLSGDFGSMSYAKEELRAELASCAIGSMIGLPCDVPNHASYLQS